MSPKMSTDENIDVRKANNRQMCSTIKRPLARGQERHPVFPKTDLIFHFPPPIHIFPIAHSTHMDLFISPNNLIVTIIKEVSYDHDHVFDLLISFLQRILNAVKNRQPTN